MDMCNISLQAGPVADVLDIQPGCAPSLRIRISLGYCAYWKIEAAFFF